MKEAKNSEDWVDIHDDDLMVKLGIRNPTKMPRDKSVWSKTPYEKRLIKSEKRKHKEKMHFSIPPSKSIPVRAKLIVYLKNNKKFNHTTYSTECWQHEIGDVLSRYRTGDNKSLVIKYSYNGRTYAPTERPFWPGN